MKIHKIVLALLFTMAFGAAAASAATADFAGNCTLDYGNPQYAYCVFDALRDTADADPSVCPGSSISSVFWDFGDGTWAWDDTFVSHTFVDPLNINGGATAVTISIFCADNTTDDGGRYVVFAVFGCGRCLNMNTGWD